MDDAFIAHAVPQAVGSQILAREALNFPQRNHADRLAVVGANFIKESRTIEFKKIDTRPVCKRLLVVCSVLMEMETTAAWTGTE